MNIEIDKINDRLDNLRCDLAATWQALGAMQAALSAQQRQTVLQAMAKASAQKQALYDAPLSTPQAQEQLQRYRAQMQKSEQRVYDLMQGAGHHFQPPKENPIL